MGLAFCSGQSRSSHNTRKSTGSVSGAGHYDGY